MNLTLVSDSSEDENEHALVEDLTGIPWVTIVFGEGFALVNPDVKSRVAKVMMAAAISAMTMEDKKDA